jgi:hypothetical protein
LLPSAQPERPAIDNFGATAADVWAALRVFVAVREIEDQARRTGSERPSLEVPRDDELVPNRVARVLA